MDLSSSTESAVANRECNRAVQRLEVAPVNLLEAAQVNPKCFVMSHERVHVHGLSYFRARGAKGFGMVHEAAEVGRAQAPQAEGAPVNASSKVDIVLAGLQPPENVTSLGVEAWKDSSSLSTSLLCTCYIAPENYK